MNKESISIISTLTNIFLAFLKLIVGFIFKSSALVADGIHSGIDIFSSFVTYIGIKASQKPSDKKHPYGYLRYETIAGFIVTILLFLSALWILYEGLLGLIINSEYKFGLISILVVILSILLNEIMARLKFKIGKKEDNLALIADAKHSRADSISSIGVLIALFLSIWFKKADAITALLIGLYILYETYLLGKEVIDNLLDVSCPKAEKEIKKICKEEEISLLDLKTRKIGSKIFAHLKIGLNKNWRIQKVDEIVSSLEKILIKKVENLEFITIEISSHNLRNAYLKSEKRSEKCEKIRNPKIQIPKKDYRILIPWQGNKIYKNFGSPEYFVIDKKNDKITLKKKIKNPYYHIGKGHGMKIVKDLLPNEIITKDIGENLKKELSRKNIKISFVSGDFDIGKFLKKKNEKN